MSPIRWRFFPLPHHPQKNRGAPIAQMDRASDYESAGRPFESGWARHTRMDDEKYMKIALEEAIKASRNGEVPIGAVLLKGDRVIAKDHNRCIELSDPTGHAEMLVLRKGGKVLRNYRLTGTVIYVTAEPCPMCASAMVHARISKLVFGTLEPKFGAVESRFRLFQDKELNHKVEVEGGILEKECAGVLKDFFRKRRESGDKARSGEQQVKKIRGSRLNV